MVGAVLAGCSAPTRQPTLQEAAAWVEPRERPFEPSPAAVRAIARDAERQFKAQLPNQAGRCRVGVVCDDGQAFEGPSAYIRYFVRAVMDSGGEPRLLFPSRASVSKQMQGIDALLVPGGADVHPSFYGQKAGPGMSEAHTWPEDDRFGIDCINTAYQSDMPLLGICRGMQLMNVAAGGTLIQDIPTEFESPYGLVVDHRPEPPREEPARGLARSMPSHDMIILDTNSQLAQLLGTTRVGMNSVHHQALGVVAPTLAVTAIAPDGIVEAVERRDVPCQIGLQGHPELIRRVDSRFQSLFDNLVTHGARYHQATYRISP